MTIAIACDCGRSLRLKDELAGRKVRCPDCSTAITVPTPRKRRDVEEEEEDGYRRADDRDEPVRRRRPRDEEPEERYSDRDPRRRSRDPVPPDLDVRKKSYRRPKDRDRDRGPRVAVEEGWFGSLNAGVIGGALMMLIAVVWFVLGLAGGIIFFYPPILFVIGIVAMVKGAMGGGN
jgi:hypothetical protein